MVVGFLGSLFKFATMWDVKDATYPVDIIEYPDSYVFMIDMPGLKSVDIEVKVKDDNVLAIIGENKKEEEKEGVKYLRIGRKVGMFMHTFDLPKNANIDAVSALYQDGVLSVTVEKLSVLDHLRCNRTADDPNPKLPPRPKKLNKTIEVKVV